MEQTLSISDDVASHVNRFAASHDVDVDDAYELLVTVGLETLANVELAVYVEDDQLILDCPACESIFESVPEAVEHECDTHE